MDKLFAYLQYFLPKHLLTKLFGFIASLKMGVFTSFLIKTFIKKYKVDMSQAKNEEIESYATFNDFFMRKLKDEQRPIAKDDFVFPCDGTIANMGEIFKEKLIQAKDHDYSLDALLASKNKDLIAKYKNGKFMTIYLAPKDYHLVHVPIDCTLEKMTYVEGDLFSVNKSTVENIKNVFAKNERVIFHFSSSKGDFVLVMIGAMIVGSIETVFAGTIASQKQSIFSWDYHLSKKISFKKGEQLGGFKLGSTVIFIAQQDISFKDDLKNEDSVKIGNALAKTLVKKIQKPSKTIKNKPIRKTSTAEKITKTVEKNKKYLS